ncbi:MAG: hypothetical protein KTR35_12380 [Gammaproteobacteria bacterium]|nr:hypothetical protein [Gammaproteobacteria bacterium]
MTKDKTNELNPNNAVKKANSAALAGAKSGWARPAAILDGEAAAAWQAYNAMQATKQRHYDLLAIVDNKKKKFNIDATDKDVAILADLLEDHDSQVKRFTKASSELKLAYPEAHRALFEYIGMINQAESTGLEH